MFRVAVLEHRVFWQLSVSRALFLPFLFRVLVNPKRFFSFLLSLLSFTISHESTFTYFCKDDDARRRRGGRERDAVESSR